MFISFESSSGVRWFGIPRSPPVRDVWPTKNPPARAPGGSVGPSVGRLHGHSGPLPSQVHVPIVAAATDDVNAAEATRPGHAGTPTAPAGTARHGRAGGASARPARPGRRR